MAERSDSTAASALWLVANADRSNPKVMRAVSAAGAIKGRFKDAEDPIRLGNVAVWRLGNYPAQFEVTHDGKGGFAVRELGNPHV
jgi:hypothetical protein